MVYVIKKCFQSGELGGGGADDKKKKKRNEVNTAASVRTCLFIK